jgi:hypothetical protein
MLVTVRESSDGWDPLLTLCSDSISARAMRSDIVILLLHESGAATTRFSHC